MSDSSPLRPNAAENGSRLADQPLTGDGLKELLVLRARTTGPVEHGATITVYSPRTDDGRVPQSPSIVLAHVPEFEMLRTGEPRERRRFEWDGATMRAQVPVPAGTLLFGTGEAAGPFVRNKRHVVTYNHDAWAYSDLTPSLYQSHPYVLCLLPDGRAMGVLADTPHRGIVHTADDGVEFDFAGEPFDLYVIEGESPQEVQSALSALIGSITAPPDWALGYHQCRYSYMNEDEVREVARQFVKRGLPCSAIWFDIDYMDRYRVFTWNAEAFPDPKELIEELHGMGFKAVAILDPGIAVAPGYEPYDSGLAGDHFVTLPGGQPAKGRVWPGICHFPDFTREETRAWWADQVQRFLEAAPLDGLWCDMNEPAVFRTPGKTLPDHVEHRGSGGGDHAKFHNLYGQLMAEATREGWMAANPGAPPFILTRAAHLSGARHAATWTGDNQARWEDLEWAVPMVLNLGLSGQPFSGPDVGGFFGDPSSEQFERWFELGAYLPFFRGHAEESSCRKEPWSFGPESEARIKLNLELRVLLLPLLRQLFAESAATGLPVCRPLFFADSTDERLREVGDAFLLGPDLLVAPACRPGQTERTVALPAGRWRACVQGAATGDLLEGDIEIETPLGRAPAFLRENRALPV